MGRSLKIYVTEDSPRSLKKITQFNWSGYAFYGTREQIKSLSKREEGQSSGVYFLFSDLKSETVNMYVGESENFVNRLQNHIQKDWWTHFIVFQSEGSFLNKAHIRYLEYVFWDKANNSPEINLLNSQSPKKPNLSEDDISDLKVFEENMLFVLEALSLGFFSSNQDIASSSTVEGTYTCKVPNSDQHATMIKLADRYILKSGSCLKSTPRESFEKSKNGYFERWKKIMNPDYVEHTDQGYSILKKDLEFTSSSAAGAIVRAASTNGPLSWINKETGSTLKDELAND